MSFEFEALQMTLGSITVVEMADVKRSALLRAVSPERFEPYEMIARAHGKSAGDWRTFIGGVTSTGLELTHEAICGAAPTPEEYSAIVHAQNYPDFDVKTPLLQKILHHLPHKFNRTLGVSLGGRVFCAEGLLAACCIQAQAGGKVLFSQLIPPFPSIASQRSGVQKPRAVACVISSSEGWLRLLRFVRFYPSKQGWKDLERQLLVGHDPLTRKIVIESGCLDGSIANKDSGSIDVGAQLPYDLVSDVWSMLADLQRHVSVPYNELWIVTKGTLLEPVLVQFEIVAPGRSVLTKRPRASWRRETSQ